MPPSCAPPAPNPLPPTHTQAARTSKRGSAEAEAGLLAVEGLHRQVMPFILRRTKDAVLADLPPKIVQASCRGWVGGVGWAWAAG